MPSVALPVSPATVSRPPPSDHALRQPHRCHPTRDRHDGASAARLRDMRLLRAKPAIPQPLRLPRRGVPSDHRSSGGAPGSPSPPPASTSPAHASGPSACPTRFLLFGGQPVAAPCPVFRSCSPPPTVPHGSLNGPRHPAHPLMPWSITRRARGRRPPHAGGCHRGFLFADIVIGYMRTLTCWASLERLVTVTRSGF